MRRLAPGIILVVLFATAASAQPLGPPGGGFGGGHRHPFAPPGPAGPGKTGDMNQTPADEVGHFVDRSAPLHKQIDTSIEHGLKFLLSQQKDDGSWGEGGAQRGVGETALAGLALLSCGVSHQSPELTKAIAFLKKTEPEEFYQTYSIGLRAAFYSQLPESIRKRELQADLNWLQGAVGRNGMYTYRKNLDMRGDYSNSQYGVLGVWYAAMAGLEVPNSYWRVVEDGWRSGQATDGGWGYRPHDSTYASMTAAGAATLYITYDYLHSPEELDLKRAHMSAHLDNAIKWLGINFAVDFNVGLDSPEEMNPAGADDGLANVFNTRPRIRHIGRWVHYMLFGYERVGEASGLTRFGVHKWFEEGSNFLIDVQNADGSWTGSLGKNIDTSYALLFLSRGRSPVAIQKLQFKGNGARWNNRSRDVAAVAKWLTRQTERHTNWQIVPAEAPPNELREAPILYVASDKALSLRDSDKQRIKTYIDQGGLLLAVNEGATKEFTESVYTLAKEIYPAYEFRNLPIDHVIYGENFPVKALQTLPRALSNGVRELIILLPSGDMSWKLQQGAGTNNPAGAPQFAFLGNLYIYMNDKANPRFKGDDTWIDADPKGTDKSEMIVARLKINANWDPEPLGWTRLANILHNTDGMKLTTMDIDPTMMSLPNTIRLAHLTASNEFELSDVQQRIVKGYLDGGGVLLFDAAGGSTAAQLSFETTMAKMYPNQKFKTLPIDHPIYTGENTGGAKITQATYRRYAMERIAKTTLPRLRVLEMNGRIVAIDSSEDLSAGLVGYNIDGIVGYSPASATEIVRNIILWASNSATPAPVGKAQ